MKHSAACTDTQTHNTLGEMQLLTQNSKHKILPLPRKPLESSLYEPVFISVIITATDGRKFTNKKKLVSWWQLLFFLQWHMVKGPMKVMIQIKEKWEKTYADATVRRESRWILTGCDDILFNL